jgi:phospholipid/cholesterol/gamma-HCH transport system permease protein
LKPRLNLETCSFAELNLNLERRPGQAQSGESWVLHFHGAMRVENLARLENYFILLGRQPALPQSLELDLSALEYMDSDSAWLLNRLDSGSFLPLPVQISGLKPELARIKDLVRERSGQASLTPPRGQSQGMIESLGMLTHALGRDLYNIIEFFGNIIPLSLRLLARPQGLRWKETALQMQLVGWGGLPVVGLIALLLGMIISFMSIMQLRPYGAEIYVASLVAVAMVKELGPIMTAIILAGRSGSAFAAEIGSMKENEELDALAVMGYNPILFLALPRVAATMAVMPLLTMFANFFGILGGLIVGVALMGLSGYSYLDHTINSLAPTDIVLSSVKVTVFAFLIAGVGCQRGFMVRGGSSAVGQATTSSVVTAIFIIILVDSIFAMVELYGGW